MAFTSDAGVAAEVLIKNHMAAAPAAKGKKRSQVLPDLPVVEAPDLDDLYVEVSVQAVSPASSADIDARLDALSATLGECTARKAGDVVQPGDEILIDLAAYEADRLIPGTSRLNMELPLDGSAFIPELARRLSGRKVGDKCKIEITVPPTIADVRYRGRRVRFQVNIKAARRIARVDLRRREILDGIEVGLTFEGLRKRTAELVLQERLESLRTHAINAVLDEVCDRIGHVDIPEPYIDAQIHQLWFRAEGHALAEMGASFLEQRASLDAYRAEPSFREDAERRAKIAVVILAIMKKEGFTVDEAAFRGELDRLGEVVGSSGDALWSEVGKNRADALAIVDRMLYQRSLEHILSKAVIAYVNEETGEVAEQAGARAA